ncbi:MAG: Crp/Fnr family transcriptional regulator, partial [Gammaproteobacteria bacterium]|nr:Crp/Fnr family transcriptional regulator [Gammaproteobacteria bacterium]
MSNRPKPTPTGCSDCAVRRLALFGPLTPAHVEAMQAHRLEQRGVPAGGLLYAQDALMDESFTVFDGWVMLHRTLSDGRRQVLRFALPGDFIGFHAHSETPSLHSALALTPVRVCVFKHDSLMAMFRQQPELAIQMAWITSRDEAITYDHLMSLGRRPAKERIAQLFLELHHRLSARGPVDERAGIPVPLKQQHIADALGLTSIHVSRTLRALHEAGLVVLRGGLLRILDRPALVDMTGFRPEPFRH